jgi:hypothetical protein
MCTFCKLFLGIDENSRKYLLLVDIIESIVQAIHYQPQSTLYQNYV